MVALLAVVFTTIDVYAETTLVSDYSIGVIEWEENGINEQAIIAYISKVPKIDTSRQSPYTCLTTDKVKAWTLNYNSLLDCIVVDTIFSNYTRNANLQYYYYILGATEDISNITWYGDDSIAGAINKSLSDVDLPQGLTIDDIYNELNKKTDISSSATTIINNTTNIYNQYVSGDISYIDLQYQITQNINQLKSLSESDGATLADLIQINNGLTYSQTVQDLSLADRNESYWDSKDISRSVAESTIADDKAQIEYLNELTLETTQKLSDFAISGKINDQAKTSTVNILNVLYNNEILKLVIPIAATLMLVCIVLGIKYRL